MELNFYKIPKELEKFPKERVKDIDFKKVHFSMGIFLVFVRKVKGSCKYLYQPKTLG